MKASDVLLFLSKLATYIEKEEAREFKWKRVIKRWLRKVKLEAK